MPITVYSKKGVVMFKALGNTNSTLLPFLSLLEQDILENQQNTRTISTQELSKTEQLLVGIEINLNEKL